MFKEFSLTNTAFFLWVEGRYDVKSKKDIREQITDALRQIALGQVSDPVRLMLYSSELTERQIKRLNLTNVSGIKRSAGGISEIKFFDRIKAIQCLLALEEKGSGMGSALLEALSLSAREAQDEE